MDVRLGRPDSQPEPELNAPANSNAPSHTVTDQKPTRSPRPRSRLQRSRTWRLESVISEYDFEKRKRPPETTSGRILGSRVDGGTAWENAETS